MKQTTNPNEKPIIFQGWKITKILGWDFDQNGNMQTRRLLKISPMALRDHISPKLVSPGVWDFYQNVRGGEEIYRLNSPYGVPGDYLWVKENYAVRPIWDNYKPSEIVFNKWAKIPSSHPLGYAIFYPAADPNWDSEPRGKLRTSLFMPREASRILLQIVDIEPQRLHDIKESDAIPEGWSGERASGSYLRSFLSGHGRQWYFNLWDKLNGTKKLDTISAVNPWVWKITFKKAGPK